MQCVPERQGQDHGAISPANDVLPGDLYVDTSRHRVIARVLERHVPVFEQGNDGLVVEQGGIADTGADHVRRPGEQLVRGAIVISQCDAGLWSSHALGRFQHQVRHLVRDVVAMLVHSAQGDGLKRRHAAVGGRQRGGVDQAQFVKLDPQQLQQLRCFFAGRSAVLQIVLVIGTEHLVEPHSDPQRGVLDVAYDMDEEEGLQRLEQRSWWMLRHTIAGPGDRLQPLPVLGVVGPGGLFPGHAGIPVCKLDDRFERDDHGLKEFLLSDVIHGDFTIDVLQPGFRLADQASEADTEDLLVVGNAEFRPMRPEADTAFRHVPVLQDIAAEHVLLDVAHGPAVPVLDELFQLEGLVSGEQRAAFFAADHPSHGPPVHVYPEVQPLRRGNVVSHDAFPVLDVQVHASQDPLQGLGPADHHGFALGFPVGLGQEPRPLQIELDSRAIHPLAGLLLPPQVADVVHGLEDQLLTDVGSLELAIHVSLPSPGPGPTV